MSKLKDLPSASSLTTLVTNLFTLPTQPPVECTCVRDILKNTAQREAKLAVTNAYLQDQVEASEGRVAYYKKKTAVLRKALRGKNLQHKKLLEEAKDEAYYAKVDMHTAEEALKQCQKDLDSLESKFYCLLGSWAVTMLVFLLMLALPFTSA